MSMPSTPERVNITRLLGSVEIHRNKITDPFAWNCIHTLAQAMKQMHQDHLELERRHQELIRALQRHPEPPHPILVGQEKIDG